MMISLIVRLVITNVKIQKYHMLQAIYGMILLLGRRKIVLIKFKAFSSRTVTIGSTIYGSKDCKKTNNFFPEENPANTDG
jgi:hypothetical protein